MPGPVRTAYGTIKINAKKARKNPISSGGISVAKSRTVRAINANEAQAKHIHAAPRTVAGNLENNEEGLFTRFKGLENFAAHLQLKP